VFWAATGLSTIGRYLSGGNLTHGIVHVGMKLIH